MAGQDSVTLWRILSRGELLGTRAALMTTTVRPIVERIDVVGDLVQRVRHRSPCAS